MDYTPIGIFVSAFMVSGLAGLAALLRCGCPLTYVKITSSFLNSGLLGLGISLLWYLKFQENLYFLVGICVLTGLSGMTAVEFILESFKKAGFSIKIGKDKFEPGERHD